MPFCLHCGHENAEAATICAYCQRALLLPAVPAQPLTTEPAPEKPAPLPAAPEPGARRKALHYFLGLGVGLVPFFSFLLGIRFVPSSPTAASDLLRLSLGLYLVFLPALYFLISNKSARFIGYGLLTTVLISPIVACIAFLLFVPST
jgi:hypothetical protein